MTLRLTIPLPLSTNALYRNLRGKGRVKTDRYRTWLRNAQNEVMTQKRKHYAGDCELRLVAKKPDKRRRDLDNLLKCTQDLLTTCGIVDDDQQFIKVSAEWGDETYVEIKECGK